MFSSVSTVYSDSQHVTHVPTGLRLPVLTQEWKSQTQSLTWKAPLQPEPQPKPVTAWLRQRRRLPF